MHTIRHHLDHWWIYKGNKPILFGPGSIETGLALANRLGVKVCKYRSKDHGNEERRTKKAA